MRRCEPIPVVAGAFPKRLKRLRRLWEVTVGAIAQSMNLFGSIDTCDVSQMGDAHLSNAIFTAAKIALLALDRTNETRGQLS